LQLPEPRLQLPLLSLLLPQVAVAATATRLLQSLPAPRSPLRPSTIRRRECRPPQLQPVSPLQRETHHPPQLRLPPLVPHMSLRRQTVTHPHMLQWPSPRRRPLPPRPETNRPLQLTCTMFPLPTLIATSIWRLVSLRPLRLFCFA
ncbi:hypothetical protein HK100_006105, partial [Physocladia obscura]